MEKKEKDYGLGWFYFYIKWRFPIGFVLGAFSIFNEIIQGIDKGYFSHSGYVFFTTVDILYIVCSGNANLGTSKLRIL